MISESWYKCRQSSPPVVDGELNQGAGVFHPEAEKGAVLSSRVR
jgi:hypothetical protein